jgi:hypothetical protein
VVDPYCGDGSCNGGESQGSCCNDCGCPGTDVCQGGGCTCTEGTLHVTNVLQDASQYCFGTSTWYTQYSAAYFSYQGTTYYFPANGTVDFTDALGTTEYATVQCCYLDACGGNLSCQTPNGTYPCLCANAYSWSGTISACGVSYDSICN